MVINRKHSQLKLCLVIKNDKHLMPQQAFKFLFTSLMASFVSLPIFAASSIHNILLQKSIKNSWINSSVKYADSVLRIRTCGNRTELKIHPLCYGHLLKGAFYIMVYECRLLIHSK